MAALPGYNSNLLIFWVKMGSGLSGEASETPSPDCGPALSSLLIYTQAPSKHTNCPDVYRGTTGKKVI